MTPFILDAKLQNDSAFVTDWELSQIRLSRNASFPWILLIPARADIVEIIDMTPQDQAQLFREIVRASHVMRDVFAPKKLNVAALGNVVPQLHVHVIARFDTDGAWPSAVWSSGVISAYSSAEMTQRIAVLKAALDAARDRDNQ